MKRSTRKYAKRQIAWLQNKLLPAIQDVRARNGDKHRIATLYVLDATALGDSWTSNVFRPAESIMNAFLNDEYLPDPAALSSLAEAMLATGCKSVNPIAVLRARRKVVCSVCTLHPSRPVMVEEGAQMKAHQKTRLHRRLAGKSRSSLSDDASTRDRE